jgi:hypothetical protein
MTKMLAWAGGKPDKVGFSNDEAAKRRLVWAGKNVHTKLVKYLSKCILFDR